MLASSGNIEETAVVTTLPIDQRFNYFQGREERWLNRSFGSDRPIRMEINHRHSHINGLVDGIYYFGELGDQIESIFARGLRYYQLPNCRHEESGPLRAAHRGEWDAIDFAGKEALALALSPRTNLLAMLHLVRRL